MSVSAPRPNLSTTGDYGFFLPRASPSVHHTYYGLLSATGVPFHAVSRPQQVSAKVL
mgnify:CR=1 FL=1